MADYRKILAAPQEKIIDLLKGTGEYKGYSVEQRRKLWNRWVKTTTQRVIKNANLSAAQMSYFDLSNFQFPVKTCLEGADLAGAIMSGVSLVGAILVGANLHRAYLVGANLNGANLYGADLSNANLEGARLALANLEGANLRGAILSGAQLAGANLEGADLAGANLKKAILVRADLAGANLNGANIEGADLKSVQNLTSAQLAQAKNADKAKNPPSYLLN